MHLRKRKRSISDLQESRYSADMDSGLAHELLGLEYKNYADDTILIRYQDLVANANAPWKDELDLAFTTVATWRGSALLKEHVPEHLRRAKFSVSPAKHQKSIMESLCNNLTSSAPQSSY